jgi:hypothetical protein
MAVRFLPLCLTIYSDLKLRAATRNILTVKFSLLFFRAKLGLGALFSFFGFVCVCCGREVCGALPEEEEEEE